MTNHIGQRIKSLREKAGFSRSQFSSKFGISASTLRSYESGDTSIPDVKMAFFKNIFRDLGFDLDVFPTQTDTILDKESISPSSFHLNDINIKREIDFFKKINADFVLYTVTNNFMYPIFNPGDILGGIKNFDKGSFQKFCGIICIVLDLDSEKFIGRVLDVNKDSVFISPCNHSDARSYPFTEVKNTLAIAQVTRHWCLNGIVRL